MGCILPCILPVIQPVKNRRGGSGLIRAGLIWYVKPPNMVDSIGLSATTLWAALPAEHRTIYLVDENTLRSAEDIITNIEASEYLNDGGELVGNSGYAQYEDGTAESILRKAYRYFGVVWPIGYLTDIDGNYITDIDSNILEGTI